VEILDVSEVLARALDGVEAAGVKATAAEVDAGGSVKASPGGSLT
jgi:hypothetical protein